LIEAFVFNEIAITVRHWFELGPDDNEHGARIEIRRLVAHDHRGSPFAAQLIEIDPIVWRADLFDVLTDKPGNLERAHHHMQFDGIEPQGRDWDERLSADPFGWLEQQLDGLEQLLAAKEVQLRDVEGEAEEVRRNLPAIMSAARRCAGAECTTPQQCANQTRDTKAMVDMMSSLYRNGSPDGDPRPAGW
jgi:hypothetical protein